MKKVLWILECDNGFGSELVPFYATSQEDAEKQAQERITRRRQVPRLLTPRKLCAFPNGFTMHYGRLPGILKG